MHPSVCLAEEALEVAREEAQAFERGELEKAEALSRKRCRLLDEACGRQDPECASELRARLEAVREILGGLIDKASSAHAALAEELKDMRRRDTGRKGYRNVAATTAYSGIPMYVSRRG